MQEEWRGGGGGAGARGGSAEHSYGLQPLGQCRKVLVNLGISHSAYRSNTGPLGGHRTRIS